MKILPTKFTKYEVSDEGQVYFKGNPLKSHDRGNKTSKGGRYQAVNISLYDDNGKFQKQIKYYVHRLVAEAFIENPENLPDIDHIDENKENNVVSNLRWSTRAANMERNGLPEGTIVERLHGTRNKGHRQPSRYIKKEGEWVLIPSERPAWNKGLRSGAADGTLTKCLNGHWKIKEDGVWVHVKVKEYAKYGLDK